ncbi:hypothetical protein BCR36DRAFT_359284 [Piromyces finnis]|uniref:Uncharacterized protein n=1 Tax=Piromyces finnis TaxID=1754191 RepID=A0A1Y1V0J4_9FUNG|nr:hypothetical protein BCR36DRAFT_359284 [Piromyces finnis]|eukprot:ORX44637.1 hypothetical protein BCR36DRAFT_359284 [Piromyces finnis]
MKYYISQAIIIYIVFGFFKGVFSQALDISNKNRCLQLNEKNVCNAATQSGCSWCTSDWGCMFVSDYDIITQSSTQYYHCPEPCVEGDKECYKIMDDSSLLEPFFFYLSTRSGMVCHLQHTNEVSRLHTFHCDEFCRQALMNDYGYCQFYDDNGKEFKDYKISGGIEKKSSKSTIIIIIVVAVVGLIIIGIGFKIYLNKHNKILEERRKIEMKDTKLENDLYLKAQIAFQKEEMKDRQKEGMNIDSIKIL